VLEIFSRKHSLAQAQHLRGDEVLDLVRLAQSLFHREVSVVGIEVTEEAADRDRVAMRQSELGVLDVDLERMTGLALRREGNALIIVTPLAVGFVAIAALQLPSAG